MGDQRRTKRQRPLNDDFVVVTEKEEARVKKMMYTSPVSPASAH